jgi:S1-C subfamily serine protease
MKLYYLILGLIHILGFELIQSEEINAVENLNPKEIYERSSKAVVLIKSFNKEDNLIATGTGFFINEKEILTCFHVLENSYSAQFSFLGSGRVYDIKNAIKADEKTDIALLTSDKTCSIPLVLGSSENIAVGEKVYTLGNPKGLTGTFSDGLISNLS